MFSGSKARWQIGLPTDQFFKLGLVVAVLQGLAAVALMGVSAWLISRAAEVSSIVYLGIAIVGVRGFAIGRATFRYVERLLLHESAFRMLGERRPQIFKALVPFIPAGMATRGRGQTISLVVNDVDELQNLPLRVIAPLAQSLVVGAISVFFMATLMPSVGLALLITLAAAFFIAIPLSARYSKNSDEAIAPIKANLANQSVEILEHQDVLLAYGWMPAKLEEFGKTDKLLRKTVADSAVSNGVGLALISAFSTMAVLAGAWFGAGAVNSGSQPGVLLAVFALLPLVVFEVIQASQPAVSSFRKYVVSADRVNGLINRQVPVELQIGSGTSSLSTFKSLGLHSVGIRYPGASSEAVSGVNLTLRPGESVMVSGESGAGKSSIALVLSRMLNASGGSYTINDKDVDEYRAEDVRKLVGFVEQSPTIFLGDLRANLTLAKPDATDDELIAVLERVGLWSMFSGREGLKTQLGDRGVMISGGEAQRLSLARAILADFRVLILDEPTANVDRETADILVADMLSVVKSDQSRAVVLITHEPRFEKLVDKHLRL